MLPLNRILNVNHRLRRVPRGCPPRWPTCRSTTSPHIISKSLQHQEHLPSINLKLALPTGFLLHPTNLKSSSIRATKRREDNRHIINNPTSLKVPSPVPSLQQDNRLSNINKPATSLPRHSLVNLRTRHQRQLRRLRQLHTASRTSRPGLLYKRNINLSSCSNQSPASLDQ